MNIRVATIDDMPAVWELTYEAFLKRGLCAPNDVGQLQHYPHLDGIAETTVLIAEDESGLVGTITVTQDGPQGLHVDKTFPGVVRYGGVRNLPAGYRDHEVGAVWRLAVRGGGGVHCLVGAALQELVTLQLSVVVIVVHPGQVSFYERRLGFKEVSRVDHDPTVNNAPAVLMIGRLETMSKKWKQKG